MIDRTGKYWRGETFDDLAEYLREFEPGGYPVEHVNELICRECAGAAFVVEADDTEGCARACCIACQTVRYVADGADDADDADLVESVCPCGNKTFAVAVGFAVRDDQEVRWISVGLRCAQDGTLGLCADWKIDYSPSRHLLADTT